MSYGPPNSELRIDLYFDGEYRDSQVTPKTKPGTKKITGEILGSDVGRNFHCFVFSKPDIIGAPKSSSSDVP